MSSIFTAPGTSAANNQNAQNASVSVNAAKTLGQLYPALSSAMNTAVQYEPQRQATISNLLKLGSQGNNLAQEQAYSNQAFSNAARAGQQAIANDQAAGLSPAYSAGQNTYDQNAAANASNAYDAQVNSPEYQTQQGLQNLQLYGQAQNSPIDNLYNSTASLVYGQPKANVGTGFGDVIGRTVGGLLSGPLSGPLHFGGSGGGASTDTSGADNSGDN